MMYLLVIFLLTSPFSLFADLTTAIGHGRAVASAQKGDWKGAQERLQAALVDNPDDATVLYDLGVASYKQKEFEHAQVYFDAVTQSHAAPTSLKEQAYFNAGNTAVELKKLHDAVDAYEQTLTLNDKNEAAQHNLELVRKMLQEQQQKEQQKKDQNQQKDTQEKDKQDQKQDQSAGQDKQESQSSDQQDKGQQQDGKDGGDDQPEQSDGQRGNQHQEQKQSGGSDTKNNKDGKGNQGGDKQEGDDAGEDDQLEQKKDKADQKTQDRQQQGKNNDGGADKQQREQQQGGQDKRQREQDKHKDLSGNDHDQQQHNTEDTKNKQGKGSAGVQSASSQEPPQTPEQRWITQLMEQQEKRDANANKQVIRRAINQKLSGSNGQNRW
jgi:Ca-activated chloride channel homolog